MRWGSSHAVKPNHPNPTQHPRTRQSLGATVFLELAPLSSSTAVQLLQGQIAWGQLVYYLFAWLAAVAVAVGVVTIWLWLEESNNDQ